MFQHRRLAAEQMGSAGDVQEQAVGYIHATQGVKRSHQSAIRSSSESISLRHQRE